LTTQLLRQWSAQSERHKVLLLTGATLVLALLLQVMAATKGRHIVSDIPTLFDLRGIRPSQPPYLRRPLEYPVLTGLVLWLTSFPGTTRAAFFAVNAAVLAALAFVVSVALQRRCGQRARRWALALPLLLYAFHNWDLVAVAPAVTGLIAFEAGSDVLAGFLLALGASAKLFPGLFVPALVVSRLRSGDRPGAVQLAAGFVAIVSATKIPVLLLNAHGWWFPFRFQSHRTAGWGTVWFHLFHLPGIHPLLVGHLVTAANVTSLVVLLSGSLWVMWRAWRSDMSPYAIGALQIAVFLAASKVYSPQYDLWLVPFFVLLPLSRRVWFAFCATDLLMYLVVFGHVYGTDRPDLWMIGVAAVARLLVLFAVVRAVSRGPISLSPDRPVATRSTTG